MISSDKVDNLNVFSNKSKNDKNDECKEFSPAIQNQKKGKKILKKFIIRTSSDSDDNNLNNKQNKFCFDKILPEKHFKENEEIKISQDKLNDSLHQKVNSEVENMKRWSNSTKSSQKETKGNSEFSNFKTNYQYEFINDNKTDKFNISHFYSNLNKFNPDAIKIKTTDNFSYFPNLNLSSTKIEANQNFASNTKTSNFLSKELKNFNKCITFEANKINTSLFKIFIDPLTKITEINSFEKYNSELDNSDNISLNSIKTQSIKSDFSD